MSNDKLIKVVIGTPCFTGQMDAEVAGRIGMHLHHIAKNNPNIQIEWWIVKRSFVHLARNMITNNAIKLGFDYIWWVDDDCILPDDKHLLQRLINHDKDIVITPYYMRKPPYGLGVLRLIDNGQLREVSDYYNLSLEDMNKGLIEVDGGGTHCMLTKVEMFKEMPRPYFALPEMGGTEDMYMCLKAKEMGIKIYCDSDIEAGHIGYPDIVTSETHREFLEKNPSPNPSPRMVEVLKNVKQ